MSDKSFRLLGSKKWNSLPEEDAAVKPYKLFKPFWFLNYKNA